MFLFVVSAPVPPGFAQKPARGGEPSVRDKQIGRFERQAEAIRKQLLIPGLSLAIVQSGRVRWARGFGFADLEHHVPATPATPFHIASITKTFTSTLMMQLVERGELNLDDPMSAYDARYKDDAIKVRHVFTMTSEGPVPGERYTYNGSLYARLQSVLEKKEKQPFRTLLIDRILDPLGMTQTVPGADVSDSIEALRPTLGEARLARYVSVKGRVAKPYRVFGGEIVRAWPPPRSLDPAAGIVSTVLDLAKYDAAIDRHRFISAEMQQRVFSPNANSSGNPLPYSLGWFVEESHGLRLIWHYGHWPDDYSTLILKIPSRHLTMIALANSDALSATFYRTGGVETNPLACEFIRLFVEPVHGTGVKDPDWTLGPDRVLASLAALRKTSSVYDYSCDEKAALGIKQYLDERRTPAHVAIPVREAELIPFVGDYRLPSGRIAAIRLEGGHLYWQTPQGDRFELFAERPGRFFLKADEFVVTFASDSTGRIDHAEIEVPGRTYSAVRIQQR
jgi:CubicO group peptidase (beta-lactamase class C family)